MATLKRVLECIWEVIILILITLILAASMFPYDLYCFCDWLFNR